MHFSFHTSLLFLEKELHLFLLEQRKDAERNDESYDEHRPGVVSREFFLTEESHKGSFDALEGSLGPLGLSAFWHASIGCLAKK